MPTTLTPPKLTGGRTTIKFYGKNLEKQFAAAADDHMEERRQKGDVLLDEYVSYYTEALDRPWLTPLQLQNMGQRIQSAKIDLFEARLDEGVSAGKFSIYDQLSYSEAKRDRMVKGSEAWFEEQDRVNSLTDRIESREASAYKKEIAAQVKQFKRELDTLERERSYYDASYQAGVLGGTEYDIQLAGVMRQMRDYYEVMTENPYDAFSIDSQRVAAEWLQDFNRFDQALTYRIRSPNAFVDVIERSTQTIPGTTEEIETIARERTPRGQIATIEDLGFGSISDMAQAYLGDELSRMPTSIYIKDISGNYVKAVYASDLRRKAEQTMGGIVSGAMLKTYIDANPDLPIYSIETIGAGGGIEVINYHRDAEGNEKWINAANPSIVHDVWALSTRDVSEKKTQRLRQRLEQRTRPGGVYMESLKSLGVSDAAGRKIASRIPEDKWGELQPKLAESAAKMATEEERWVKAKPFGQDWRFGKESAIGRMLTGLRSVAPEAKPTPDYAVGLKVAEAQLSSEERKALETPGGLAKLRKEKKKKQKKPPKVSIRPKKKEKVSQKVSFLQEQRGGWKKSKVPKKGKYTPVPTPTPAPVEPWWQRTWKGFQKWLTG